MAYAGPRSFTVPGYLVDRLLGVGSQAEVWLGREIATAEPVALKRIPAGTPAAVAACRTEATALAALDHPNLIELRGCIPLDAALVLVLELAEAGTLAALLDRRGRLTAPEVVAAISPVAAALAHAHGAGLLHGDVSAANILFTRAGRPKLADLGLARLLAVMAEPAVDAEWTPNPDGPHPGDAACPVEAPRAAGSRGSSEWFGTPAYLDPTIAAGGPAGLASDVFSLAAVALHALTGAGPWQFPGEPAPSAEQAITVAATGRVPGLSERLRSAPPELAAALLRALDPDPRRRGTAAELALDLGASLPPARLELTGGRIVRHEPRRAAGTADAGGLDRVPVELDRVPLDLTRIGPPRPPADIASVLRSGALAANPDDDAQPSRLRKFGTTLADYGRRLRLRATGFRSSLRGNGGSWLRNNGRRVDDTGQPVSSRGQLDVRARQPDQLNVRSRPAGRHRPSGSAGGGNNGHASHAGLRRGSTGRRSSTARRKLARRKLARCSTGLVVAAVLVAVGVAGLPQLRRRSADAVTARHLDRPQPLPHRSTTDGADMRESVAGEPVAGGSANAGRSPYGAGIGTAAELDRILAGLSGVREQAYAQRRPDLLTAVYDSAALRAADSRQLDRSVPA
ncbi:MAG TPA: protein kinase, partial [Jatrophihabitans sp.]|nr:protein kinase [Jatrophihabitans sp.]